MGKQETLTCATGQHSWKRTSARGRKPKNCPKHPGGTFPTVAAELPATASDEPTLHEGTGTGGTSLTAALSGAAWGASLAERMKALIERDAKRHAAYVERTKS